MEAARIRELRAHLGLSQERFAQLLGVSLQTVRRWEGGLTKPLPIISVKLEELGRERGLAPSRAEGAPVAAGARPGGAGAQVGLGGLFRGVGGLVDLVSRMAAAGEEEYARSGEIQALGGQVKGVYGLSIRFGTGGQPVIEQFGNIRETESGATLSDAREPLVDVLDEGTYIRVVVELPGIEERDIHLEVRGEALHVAAATRDRKYRKAVPLPAGVGREGLESAYRNGILEVRLAKVPGR